VSKCCQVELFVALARANRKQAYSNTSWLERYDAAVLQGVDELGQVFKQRSPSVSGPRPLIRENRTPVVVFVKPQCEDPSA
jgi:hypothetical protein